MEYLASKRGASIALFIYIQFNHCIAALDIYNSILAIKRPLFGIDVFMVTWLLFNGKKVPSVCPCIARRTL